jgi:tellurite resistance protein TerC
VDHLWAWTTFNAIVLVLLAVDLGVVHRTAHRVSVREAAAWSAVWIGLSLAFGYWVWHAMGREAGLQFFAGYLIEKALSVDNIFVFILIFSYFRVPEEHQHRLLFWGILTALVMRGAMIGAGAYLLAYFHWMLYVFGAFLVVTGIRLATRGSHEIHPERSPILQVVRRVMPVTDTYQGQRFFVRTDGSAASAARWTATPLFIALVLIESADLIFALDSIPAVFAITTDPFLVYTSNVCAILGLRALYFLLAGTLQAFRYLPVGLSVVLAFVGTKMLVADVYALPVTASLGVIGAILGVAVLASILWPKREAPDVAGEESGRQEAERQRTDRGAQRRVAADVKE